MRSLFLFPLMALALSACGTSDDDGKPGTDIAIDIQTDEGKPLRATADGKTGAFAVDIPGFKAEIALPKIKLGADNFDIGGVKLYPGSNVLAMGISQEPGNMDITKVEVSFDAPAAPDVVKSWFLEKFGAKSGTTVTSGPNGITGTTSDGEPFAIDLKAGEAGHSIGKVAITTS